jgi:hypothetical protein
MYSTMSEHLNALSDWELIAMCKRMDPVTLSRFVATSKRVYTVCQKELDKKRNFTPILILTPTTQLTPDQLTDAMEAVENYYMLQGVSLWKKKGSILVQFNHYYDEEKEMEYLKNGDVVKIDPYQFKINWKTSP